jgi:transcriptional regulator with XRE-family HTH domain
MPQKNGLAAYLKDARGRMSQRELGEKINLSRERVGQLESGRTKWPEVDIFNGLARALNRPVTELLRAAGAAIPVSRDDRLEWLALQLDDEGLELLVALGHALLPTHRRRPETSALPVATLRAVAEDLLPYEPGQPAHTPREHHP